MRYPKFRAWDSSRKEMFSPEMMSQDQLTLDVNGRGFINVHSLSTKLSKFYTHLLPLEYTGLNDKNGKEICEGDVVNVYVGDTEGGDNSLGQYEAPHRIEYQRVVEWIGCGLSWKGSGCILCEGNTDFFEVIGNIHENPELLERSD